MSIGDPEGDREGSGDSEDPYVSGIVADVMVGTRDMLLDIRWHAACRVGEVPLCAMALVAG